MQRTSAHQAHTSAQDLLALQRTPGTHQRQAPPVPPGPAAPSAHPAHTSAQALLALLALLTLLALPAHLAATPATWRPDPPGHQCPPLAHQCTPTPTSAQAHLAHQAHRAAQAHLAAQGKFPKFIEVCNKQKRKIFQILQEPPGPTERTSTKPCRVTAPATPLQECLGALTRRY